MLHSGKLTGILSGMEQTSCKDMVLGKPMVVQDTTLLPIISVSTAYGGTTSQQGAGGGGIRLDPVAIVAVKEDIINVFSLRPGQTVSPLENLASLIPEILSAAQIKRDTEEQGNRRTSQ
ncbi:GerW family sporulation protein [Desulfoscipio sp. XC116]|uniref:GerW family sporulation protein n=1 Tax=Desulfoscipio sp. XC116 TaxID=3144975 RepID=UPI00325ABCC5